MKENLTYKNLNLNNLYVSHKVGLVFIIQAVFIIGLLIFNATIFSNFNKGLEKISNEEAPKAILAMEAAAAVPQVQQWLQDVIGTGDTGGFEDADNWAKITREKISTLKELEQKTSNNQEIITKLDTTLKTFEDFYSAGKVMTHTYLEQGREAGNRLMGPFDEKGDAMVASMDAIKDHYVSSQKQVTTAAAKNGSMQSKISNILATVLMLLSGFAVFMLVNSITKDVIEQIKSVVAAFKKLDEGDYSTSVEVKGTAEVKELCSSFNQTAQTLAQSKQELETTLVEANRLANEGARYQQMIDSMPINILMADLSGTIISANPASIKTLKGLEKFIPVKAEQIVGQSYDIFHKNPAHQRKLLANPANLPHQTVINVGDEKLDLLVNPIYDKDGNYSGAMLTWAVVTEQLRVKDQEVRVKRELGETITTLKSSSQNLEHTSEDLSSSVNRIASSSNEVQNYVNSVSVATEEMISSISEISKNTDKAAKMTQDAVTQMESTETIIKNLQDRSDEIASILKVVTEIANQTNLLALNATIEAARAGEAGKGFAVVANEVKELANRTAEATGDIGNKISAIQTESANALSSIGVASTSVKTINEVAVTIAGSVEEQTAVTSEIGKSMRSSTERVAEMSSDISSVADLVKSNVDRTVEINDVTVKLVSLTN